MSRICITPFTKQLVAWETPAFSDYVWAAQEDIDHALQRQILDSA
ncbi:MAG: hypothetical protein ACRESK_06770 [Gammaproteobacteria bacterium]